MLPEAPFCLFCGARCDDPDSFRLVDASDAQASLRARCLPTAFVYASVMALPPADRRPICITCCNWKRRGSRGPPRRSGRAGRKVLAPLDSILLFCLAPGQFPEPDRRRIASLLRVASDPSNGYACFVPEQAKAVMLSTRDKPADEATEAIVRAWWEANERTAFFRHPATARAVRHTCVLRDPSGNADARRWRK